MGVQPGHGPVNGCCGGTNAESRCRGISIVARSITLVLRGHESVFREFFVCILEALTLIEHDARLSRAFHDTLP